MVSRGEGERETGGRGEGGDGKVTKKKRAMERRGSEKAHLHRRARESRKTREALPRRPLLTKTKRRRSARERERETEGTRASRTWSEIGRRDNALSRCSLEKNPILVVG